MRIAFLHDRYPFGGGEKVTADIIRGITEADPTARITVIAANIDRQQLPDSDDRTSYRQLPDGCDLRHDDGAGTLVGLLRSESTDVLVLPVDPPVSLLDRVRQSLPDCRLIFLLHGSPLWQVRNKTAGSRVKALRERLLHSYTRRYVSRYRDIYDRVDCFAVLCDSYRTAIESIVGIKPGDPTSRVRAMYNPVDTKAFEQAAATPKRREVLFVGRLSFADKRVDRLLRIWRQVEPSHPDWVLKLVGEGPDGTRLRHMADSLELRNVKFCGHSANPAEHYATASILCLTSSFEGWGLVIAEAQASNVTPIAFNCSEGLKELIDKGGGITISPFDEAEYANRLSAIMESKTTGYSGRQHNSFIDSLSIAANARRWLSLFNQLLGR